MRKTCRNILKNVFYDNLIRRRYALGMTQARMAERLCMDERSYLDLDHGKTCCGAVTLALFLIYVCEDTPAFLKELRRAFDAEFDQAA